MIQVLIVLLTQTVDKGLLQYDISLNFNGYALKVCPYTSITYNCMVATPLGRTVWSLPNGTCSNPWLALTQGVGCTIGSGTIATDTCGPFRTYNGPPSNDGLCRTSVLVVMVIPALSHTVVMCNNTNPLSDETTLIGTATIEVITPPGAIKITNVLACINSVTVKWIESNPTDNATSYNISLTNTTSGDILITRSVPGDATMIIFEDLIDSTNYTVSISAINCAGSSSINSISVQTLPCAPVESGVSIVLYPNNSVNDVELYWSRTQGCPSPQFSLVLTKTLAAEKFQLDDADSVCNYSCICHLYFIAVTSSMRYTVSVLCSTYSSKWNQSQTQIVKKSTYEVAPFIEANFIGSSNSNVSSHYVNCTFLDGFNYYCKICCRTGPSFSAGAVGYLSDKKGSSVSVTLQGLGINETSYCIVTATNTNSPKCDGPVVGRMKRFLTLIVSPPQAVPQTSCDTSSLNGTLSNDAIISISVLTTALVVFSIGLVIGCLTMNFCMHKGFINVTNSKNPPVEQLYDEVEAEKKAFKNKHCQMELVNNAAYEFMNK